MRSSFSMKHILQFEHTRIYVLPIKMPLFTLVLTFSTDQRQASLLFLLLRITIRQVGYTVFDKTREGRDRAVKSPKLSSSPPLLWSSSLSSGRVYCRVTERLRLKFQAPPPPPPPFLTKPHIEVSSRDQIPVKNGRPRSASRGGRKVRIQHGCY